MRDRWTDGQTDRVKSIYPPTTSLCWGYNKLLPHLAGNQSFTWKIECRWQRFYQCMLTSENKMLSYIGKWSLDNTIGCLDKNRIYFRKKFDCNVLYCKLPIDHIQNNDYQLILEHQLMSKKGTHAFLPFTAMIWRPLSTICVHIKYSILYLHQ